MCPARPLPTRMRFPVMGLPCPRAAAGQTRSVALAGGENQQAGFMDVFSAVSAVIFPKNSPPPPPPSCLSVREWWVPAGLNRGHHGRATAAAWPRHGVSPSLCGDTGCQRGQIMSWWPPKEGCRSHRATSWVLPTSLWPRLAPLPPLVAHMASPRANGGLPVGPNHVPVGHPVDPPSSFALTAGADGTQPHLWPPQKS